MNQPGQIRCHRYDQSNEGPPILSN
jgi:hypothetical protein